jgi:hypothetical protein
VPAAQVRANRILDLPNLTRAELAEEEPRPVTESEVEPLLGQEQGRPAGTRVGHRHRDDGSLVHCDAGRRGVPLDPERRPLPAGDQAGDDGQDEQQDADAADVGEPEAPPGGGQRRARCDECSTPSGEDVPQPCHDGVSG